MSTNHKKEILELLESGKIDAAEAARLLSEPSEEMAAQKADPIAVEKEPILASEGSSKSGSMFRVRVRNMETGKNKVSVNIPVRMLRLGLKLGGHFSPELRDLDLNEINELVSEMGGGMLVEVEDEESKEHVQIFVD
jgi:ribosomal protein L7/L12